MTGSHIKTYIKKALPRQLMKKLIAIRSSARRSYSQFGEDALLRALFNDKLTGFYVDVGAYHPKEISNTCSFYQRGWRGINIEPNPANAQLFSKMRKRDINLDCLVSQEAGEHDFYIFEEGAINTLSEELAKTYIKDGYILKEVVKKPSLPLSQILDRHLPSNTAIDFLSIDVEGIDLQVLKSNNWEKYVPRVILIEDLSFQFDAIATNPIHTYLQSHNYALCSILGPTLVFMHRYFGKWYNIN